MSQHPLKSLDSISLNKIAQRFKALSEVSRLKIVKALIKEELSVSELIEKTGLGQANVSRHLKVLQAAELIDNRKLGTNVLYRVIDQTLAELCYLVCKSVKQS